MASKKKLQSIHTGSSAKLAEYEAKQAEGKAIVLRRKRDNKRSILLSVVALVIAALLQLAYFGFGPGAPVDSNNAASTPAATAQNSALVPKPEIAAGRTWSGTMELSGSQLAFELDGKAAPQAASNFISLAQQGFFKDLSCHRLTTAGIYVLQCGDPNGDGTGGPGYNWGPIENAPFDSTYKTGVLAMARVGGDASSMGSQFFIVYQDSMIPSDAVGGYSVFGKITGGLEAVQKIAAAGVEGGASDGKPALEAKLGSISLK